MRPDPKQLDQDRHALRTVLDSAETGYPKLFDAERAALERIYVFLGRPTAREIDVIVDANRISQHDAERTVDALFGKSNQ